MPDGNRRCVLIVAVALLIPAGVAAQVSQEDVDEAKRLFDEGLAAVGEGDFAGALELFERSHGLNPNPTVTFNVALCHRELDDAPAAVAALERFLEEGGPDLPAARRARAQELIDELAPGVGVLGIRIQEPGAEVFLDDERLGSSPLSERVHVAPGYHVVRAVWPGSEPEEERIAVPGGLQGGVTVALFEPAVVEESFPVPEAPEEPDEGGGLEPWWFWGTVGATGAFGLTAIVTLALAEVTYDDYVAGGRTDAALADRGESLDVATWVLAALTGAALAAGTTLYFFTDFGGGETEPLGDGAEVAVGPGSLVIRW